MIIEIESTKETFSVKVLDEKTRKPVIDICEYLDEKLFIGDIREAIDAAKEDYGQQFSLTDDERFDMEKER